MFKHTHTDQPSVICVCVYIDVSLVHGRRWSIRNACQCHTGPLSESKSMYKTMIRLEKIYELTCKVLICWMNSYSNKDLMFECKWQIIECTRMSRLGHLFSHSLDNSMCMCHSAYNRSTETTRPPPSTSVTAVADIEYANLTSHVKTVSPYHIACHQCVKSGAVSN